MEVVKNIKAYNIIKSSVITIGSYDGIHRGHHEIIRSVVNHSRALNIKSVLITFDPHPRHVIEKRNKKISLLMGLDIKLKILENLGIDVVYIIPFTKNFSKNSPKNFLEKFVIPYFNPKYIIIGNDHHFGKDRLGTTRFLKKYCAEKDISLEIIKLISDQGNKISSTHIRDLIRNGFLRRANFELGSIYGFKGKVIKGSGRGRKLNFPTANIIPNEPNQLMPKSGVYFIRARIIGLITYGMCNFGTRPTFDEKKFVLEFHLFKNDLDDIYNKEVKVEFLERIRDEIKFPSSEKLILQLKLDKQKCLKLEAKYNLGV